MVSGIVRGEIHGTVNGVMNAIVDGDCDLNIVSGSVRDADTNEPVQTPPKRLEEKHNPDDESEK